MQSREYLFRVSICIPVFNWDIRLLLSGLLDELSSSHYRSDVELIITDDSSSNAALKERNRQFVDEHMFEHLHYRELDHNVGRAKIRNLLAEEASGEFLLFLDSDVLPDEKDFLEKYLYYVDRNEWDVVCGGLSCINRIMIDKRYDFYLYLSKKIEAVPAKVRNKTPWRYLWTSNAMVRKSVFLEIPFDERFSGYGYEDSEWGIRLTRKYKVLHIDNTVSHLGLVTKEKAYQKMRNSIRNYVLLARLHPEAFRDSGIYKITSRLVFINSSLLNIADAALQKLFASNNSNALCFLIFQLNKAVLFVKELKNSGNLCGLH